MNFDAEKAIASVEEVAAQRLQRAGYHLVTAIRENISLPSRAVSYADKRGGGRKKVLGPRGSSRSRPGEFPHKDYGVLRQSIAQDFDREAMTVRVGTVLKYGKFLELGTRNMRPRPFLRRTLAEERPTIQQILTLGERVDIRVDG